ncbi:MAG: AraC family transcriptional regulator [Cereibacter changlensis]
MSFQHSFVGQTDGITPTVPARWRALDGVTSVFWEAQGGRGAQGYYLSDQPRILVFFNDVSSIRLTNDDGGLARGGRPLPRVLYVPAGLPMWTRFTAAHSFSHLDIHLHSERLLKLLAPALGRSAALDLLDRPAEGPASPTVEALAGLLAQETRSPDRHALHAEALVAGLVTGLLDLEEAETGRVEARLTQAQMRKLEGAFRMAGGRSLTVAEMAEAIGLSESWFSHLFKNATGTTPLQWQLRQRIDLAQSLLCSSGLNVAEIADRLGFTDQAHLTRVFRQVTGETPVAWRRARHGEGPT